MKSTTLKKAVFMDRDGTLIRHVDFLTKVEQVRLLPGATTAVKTLNDLGYLIILITNQPAVSRGLLTEEGVKEINKHLIRRLARQGAEIHDVFFCPHHPDAKSKTYGIKCRCRKPAPGMILKAVKKWNIDPKKSFMVGDAVIDCLAGERAGIQTILVKTGPSHRRIDRHYRKVRPGYIAENLTDAVEFMKRGC